MERDNELRERAAQVIPGGMYGHMSVLRRMPPEYPQYFERADGCRLWDVDGNEYIDYMCSYGPMIAGYANPRICAAADAQRAQDRYTSAIEKDFPSAIQNFDQARLYHRYTIRAH